MLNRRNEHKANVRHSCRICMQGADIKNNLNEAHGHQDCGSEENHPPRQSLSRTSQMEERERKKHNQKPANPPHPCPPKKICVILLKEIPLFGAVAFGGGPALMAKDKPSRTTPITPASPLKMQTFRLESRSSLTRHLYK